MKKSCDLDRLRRLRELQQRANSDTAERELAFISRLSIEDKVTGGLVDFQLWDFQSDFIRLLRDHDRVFALKARQLGITWAVLAHLLYLGIAGGNRLFLIASQSGSDAIDALHRLRILYNSIPEPPVVLVTDNTQQIALANGSRFESMMATKRAGRGKAAFATFADEVAFWSYPEEQLAALDSASQRLYAATTGNGPGDLSCTIWNQASTGVGRWAPVFYPWSEHPGRDAEWYRLNVTEAPEPRLAKREAAATPDDAFSAPGNVYFERWDAARNGTTTDPSIHFLASRGVDFGFRRWAVVWGCVTPAGQPIIFDELDLTDTTTAEGAAQIREREARWGFEEPIGVSYCDPAGKATNAQTAESEFEIFSRAGLRPYGQASGIRDGCIRMIDAIADPERPLLVHERCAHLRTALGAIRPHRGRPDVYDFDDPAYSHILDALRYWLLNNRHPAGTYKAPKAGRTVVSGIKGHTF